MKTLKITLAALTFAFFSSAFTAPKLNNEGAIIDQIQKMLAEHQCGQELTVTVFFSVSEDNRIQSIAVASADADLNLLIEKKLTDQEVTEENFRKGKIYELAVAAK